VPLLGCLDNCTVKHHHSLQILHIVTKQQIKLIQMSFFQLVILHQPYQIMKINYYLVKKKKIIYRLRILSKTGLLVGRITTFGKAGHLSASLNSSNYGAKKNNFLL